MRVAILLPCYNEEVTITGVVEGFRQALPDADIYVYDNNSTDRNREGLPEFGEHRTPLEPVHHD